MSLAELRELAEQFRLAATQGRNTCAWGYAADYEMEARIVDIQVYQREVAAHG